MEKEMLIKLINEEMSGYDIAKKLNCSQTNIRYWLKKYNLKTIKPTKKKCPKCKKIKILDEFYSRRGIHGGSVYCIECSNDEGKERARNFKKKCVEYKGGECENCGYSKYIGALHFHHKDPNEKDFSLSRVKSHSFDDKVKKELDKCLLVCANCHSEIHGLLV